MNIVLISLIILAYVKCIEISYKRFQITGVFDVCDLIMFIYGPVSIFNIYTMKIVSYFIDVKTPLIRKNDENMR